MKEGIITDSVKKVLNSIDEGIFLTSPEGVLLFMNSTGLNIVGEESVDAIAGVDIAELENSNRIDISIYKIVRKTSSSVMLRQRFQNSKGDWFDILVRQNPIFENGELLLIVGVLKDCTKLSSDTDKARINTVTPFVAVDPLSMQIVLQLEKIAELNANVVLYGETGTGKDVFTEYIHNNSLVKDGKLVKVNCAAISEQLFETEMFGYEKGSFTGALSGGKAGLIEEADGGTLFLDEINSLPMAMQGKLLRVIESKKIRRVGGVKEKDVDFRLIVATNQDLEECVNNNTFRSDLYYRLNTIAITIPPLRERKRDIWPLTEYYLHVYNAKYGRDVTLPKQMWLQAQNYPWPGNVRELKNLVEKVVIENGVSSDVFRKLTHDAPKDSPKEKVKKPEIPKVETLSKVEEVKEISNLEHALENYEKEILIKALRSGKSNAEIARLLGINISTLSRKITKYKLRFKI